MPLPTIVRADPRIPPQARIPLPTSFQTLSGILQLPLGGVSIGLLGLNIKSPLDVYL